MNHLYAGFPAMEKQIQRFNQSLLGLTGTADLYELWTREKVTKIEQLKGMKIGAVGANIPWVTAVGATAVTIKGLATMYNSLKTGVYDGGVLWQQAMAAFKFCELTKYKMEVGFGAIANALLTANMDSWAKIPREVQSAIREASATWRDDANNRLIGGAKWGRGVCEKKYGQETLALGNAERKAWASAIPNIAKQRAARQDKAGLPGTKMLVAYMDFMRAKKQLVIRNWDRE